MSKGHDIVLINGMQFQDMKVMAFVLRGDKAGMLTNTRVAETFLTVSQDQLLALHGFHIDSISNSTWDQLRITETLDVLQRATGLCPLPCNLLLAVTSINHFDHDAELRMFCPAVLIHVLLLNATPLPDRRVESVNFDDDGELHYAAFLKRYCNFCSQAISHFKWVSLSNVSIESLLDLVDGRYLRAVISGIITGELRTNSLPNHVQKSFSQIWDAITGSKEAPQLRCNILKSQNSLQNMQDLKVQKPSVLPFNHPVLDRHLSSVHLVVEEEKRTKGVKSQRVFEEVTHWHNSRKPLNSGKLSAKTTLTPKEESRLLRSLQRFHAEMTRYAESLTNSEGVGLNPEIIIVTKGGKGGKEKKLLPNHQEKARDLPPSQKQISSNLAKSSRSKQATNTPSFAVSAAWIRKRADLDKVVDAESRYAQIVAYQKQARADRKDPGVFVETRAYELSVLVEIWRRYCRKQQKMQGYHVAALIFQLLQQFTEMKGTCPSQFVTILEEVAQRCFSVDLSFSFTKAPQKLSFEFLLPTDVSLSVDMGVREFCLKYVGPYMKRALDSVQDSRVAFEPDRWQKEVLDELDASHSLFVVAPTSSGKTFISFYAMEKVLRAGDDGVVVYVAPTKALVNQIAAEVQARFKKNYKYPGTSLYAIQFVSHFFLPSYLRMS